MVDATATKENNHNTLTVPGHQLEGLLRVATVRAAPAEATAVPAAAMVTAEAAAVAAPHTVRAGELVVAAIAEAEAKYDAKQDPVQWIRCYALSIENAGATTTRSASTSPSA
jgi:hypothetical protein